VVEHDVTPVTARAHVFVADLERPRLEPGDHHHLTRVLRLTSGSPITICDGHGRWRVARLQGELSPSSVGDVVADPAPAPAVGVAFALVKGERPDLVVQKLTELGVDRIVPFAARRSVVRWDAAKAEKHRSRWDEIARAAGMQCRRTWLPEVSAVAAFEDVAALPGAALAEAGGAPPSLDLRLVLVGPEGGWDAAERSCGLPAVRLGGHVLRAETAAITAGALLTALRGKIVSHMIPAP
jgi:16S rRNA (uracil1498-N3)-methyltransferase